MKKIYALLASCMCLSGFGQDNSTLGKLMPSITRPSPTVAQLMKVEESTLDHYNGQPQIAVPLFSTKAGNLDVGLTLSYNSSGIRVSEQSGWVGKGWSLEAGGVISRSVVDMPDEIDTELHKGTNSTANKFHNIFNLADNSEERKEFVYDAQWGKRVRYDTKTDIYQFSFFGRTGRFSFTKTGGTGNLVPVIIGNDGDYKIETQITSNPLPNMYPKEITTFIITDDTGNRYYFSALERTKKKDISLTYMQEGCDDPTAPITAPEIQKFITAWHLTKVEDTNGIKLLDISYDNRQENPAKTESRTDYVLDNINTILHDTQDCTKHMRCALEPRKIISESYREIDTKRIRRINLPDGSSIRFTNTRTHPEYGDPGSFLTNIRVYNTQDTIAGLIRTFDFVYSNTAGSGPLFLDAVKTNGSDTERYAFEYYKTELYPFGAPPEERDIFGYANFEPASDAARTGVLTKISYPTKGVREFEWEPNTYSYQGSRLLTFKEIFQNPDNYDATPVETGDTYMNQNYSNTPRPYTTFSVSVEQDAVTIAETYANGAISTTSPNAIYITPVMSHLDHTVDITREELGFPINTGDYINTTIHLKPGIYKVYMWSMNASLNHVKIGGYVRIMAKRPKRHLNWFLYGGGLRIKGTKDRDRNIDQVVKGFAYNFENPGIVPTDLPPYPYLGGGTYTLSFSSGSLDGSDSLVRDYWVGINPIFNLPLMGGQPETDLTYHVLETQSDLDAQLQKGSFIGYKNVFEYFYPNVPPSSGQPLFKSKIKYTFDSPIDFPSIITASSPPLPIRGDEYKQSNVRKIEYFGSGGVGLVASEDFKYNYDTDDIRALVKKNLYFIPNAASISGFCQQVRVLYASYQNLKNNFITGDYSRDCDGGPSVLASSFYIRDKATCVQSLTSNYMSVDDYRYRSQVVESTKKEYFPSGIVETQQTFAYKPGFKRLQAQTSTSSAGQLLETKYFYPDDPEMPAGTTPYKAELIARNMIGVQLKTESYRNGSQLSAQETKYGMFTLPASPAIGNALLPQSIHTSKGSNPLEKKLTFDNYDSRGNITQYTQDSGVPVSFVWGYGKTLPLAKIDNMAYGAIPPGLISAVQGYSDGTANNEASLLSALEDLRITASAFGAMMTGYSYKPMVGISATVDPKGERTYYEYDAFGRLKVIRDRNANLVSENKYHYRTQN
ncbi:hypothetical protein [Flavobacterium microcysteis]|uniref:RHS repeat protein n=1 Tax=Flavobacterium microcysteis TaxID=2596891 RepID=A0A501QMH0_9FLAO|nr:hypothetical protein [Flavobacterium microcysteis]TPD73658.1 hypothetical protein FJA49_00255 [Flavobacterium microcysteis]